MSKKMILSAMALVAMVFAGCSKKDVDTVEQKANGSVNRTTSLNVSKLSLGDNVPTRTIVDVETWNLAWNDGSEQMFWYGTNVAGGISTKTGLNVNVDRIAFLATSSSQWGYLLQDEGRQVFKWNGWTGAHSSDEMQVKSNATFGVSDMPGSAGQEFYAGLDPFTEYYGYYFLPFVKDLKMPLSGASSALVNAMKSKGFTTTAIPINSWKLEGQDSTSIQQWLAEYDFLQARKHGSTSLNPTILPSRDGVYNSETNSYDLSIDMEHTMALVEIDMEIIEGQESANDLELNIAKIIGYDESGAVKKVFEGKAALNAYAQWEYPEVEESEIESGQVSPAYLVQCTRTDAENTSYNGSIYEDGLVKFFLLVRQPRVCDHYGLQIFCGSNYREIKFYPNSVKGSEFRFEPGGFYKIGLQAVVADAGSDEEWQSSENCSLVGVYPSNDKYWDN